MSEVQSFSYRGPRLTLELPATFHTHTLQLTGHTKNVSDLGVLVCLDGLLPTQTRGTLRIDFGAGRLELDAVVAYTELFDVGLQFCFSSDMERDFFRTLVKMLSKRINRN